MARETGSELVLSGHRVPKGTNVVCWPQLFYRDDKYFERPNEFLPERWLRDGGDDLTWDKQSQSYFMPFGHGGENLIRREFKKYINFIFKFFISKSMHRKEDCQYRNGMFAGKLNKKLQGGE